MRVLTPAGPCVRRADVTGQTALHWSAVRGSLLAAEALLGGGADARLRDGRGYTACHVAAQYGQTSWLYMAALRWRADVDRSGMRAPLAPCFPCMLSNLVPVSLPQLAAKLGHARKAPALPPQPWWSSPAAGVAPALQA